MSCLRVYSPALSYCFAAALLSWSLSRLSSLSVSVSSMQVLVVPVFAGLASPFSLWAIVVSRSPRRFVTLSLQRRLLTFAHSLRPSATSSLLLILKKKKKKLSSLYDVRLPLGFSGRHLTESPVPHLPTAWSLKTYHLGRGRLTILLRALSVKAPSQ